MNKKNTTLPILRILYFALFGLMAILVLLLGYYLWSGTTRSAPPASQVAVSAAPALGETEPVQSVNLAAFPGAEGFGTSTPGGRFGRVVFVTNLNDTADKNNPYYVGSLRWALEQAWPEDLSNPYSQRRIVIFKVGGIITLTDTLILNHPFVTIAGQTAPGDGITLRGATMTIATHDVIVRGIRVRVGDRELPSCCLDGINISTSDAESDVYNIVVDHSSISWAIDENLSSYIDPNKFFTAHDITVQWSVISEGLYNSIHLDEGATVTDPHSMGAIMGQDGANLTIHHNIFAHNWARNPRISGMVNSEIINNVIYGWKNAGVEINQDKNITHVLNNYFKAVSNSRPREIDLSDPMHPESQVYIDGNLTFDPNLGNSLITSRIRQPDSFKPSSQSLFAPSNVTMSSAEAAYEVVLNYAGVIYPIRDVVDQRIIKDIKEGTGVIIDSQDQVGGWPDYKTGIYPDDTDNDGIPSDWEVAHGLNPSFGGDANNPRLLAPSGYSWLEEYINSLIKFP